MKTNVLNTDLCGKVAMITGAGGVLCSYFAKVLARAGAKVALLDINKDAADTCANEICIEGGIAKAYACNVLDKAACTEVAYAVENDFGKCDILINGAGGNNPRATTDKEYYESGDFKFYAVACGALFKRGHSCKCDSTRLFLNQAECKAALERGWHAHCTHRKNSCSNTYGTLW